MLAIRSNERAAAAAGVDVTSIKVLVFAVSSFLAGLAGGLLGYSRGQVSVGSFTALVRRRAAGLRLPRWDHERDRGADRGHAGAVGIGYVLLNDLLGDNLSRYYFLISGISLVATSVLNPIGIAGQLALAKRRLTNRVGSYAIREDDAASGRQGRLRRETDMSDSAVGLEVRGLTCRYGGLLANNDVSFAVHPGEVVGLIGPNGAGKSTLVDAVSGFVPYRGGVALAGRSLDRLPAHRRKHAGLARTWQSGELFSDLTVRGNVQVADARLTPASFLLDAVRPGAARRSSVDRALAAVALADVADSFPSQLSLDNASGWAWRVRWQGRPRRSCSTSRPPDSTRRNGSTSAPSCASWRHRAWPCC